MDPSPIIALSPLATIEGKGSRIAVTTFDLCYIRFIGAANFCPNKGFCVSENAQQQCLWAHTSFALKRRSTTFVLFFCFFFWGGGANVIFGNKKHATSLNFCVVKALNPQVRCAFANSESCLVLSSHCQSCLRQCPHQAPHMPQVSLSYLLLNWAPPTMFRSLEYSSFQFHFRALQIRLTNRKKEKLQFWTSQKVLELT